MSKARPVLFGLLAFLALHFPLSALAADAPNQAPLSNSASPLPPMVPAVKGPIGVFRDLLSMSPMERQRLLARYSPEKRAALEGKIKEYETLTPEQRELKLRVTELRACLLPLMSMPATNRAAAVSALPPEIAPLVQARLQTWDQLSPEQQRNLLENENAIRHLIRFGSITPVQQLQVLTNMTAVQRDALRQAIEHWQRLPESERQTITKRFDEFFSLTSAEQQKTMRELSAEERAQIQKTISTIQELDPRKRNQIQGALNKICQLNKEQLAEFLKSAERWKALSPSERQAWRDLVATAVMLPPPPPGYRPPPPPPTRLPPPALSAGGKSEAVATNR